MSDLNNRWFGGRPVYAELSPVTDFREACCRQYEMGYICLTNNVFVVIFEMYSDRQYIFTLAVVAGYTFLSRMYDFQCFEFF